MRLFKTLLIAALFSFGASYAHGCGVDSVSGKTDTTITISWDVSECKHFEKVEICWKGSGNSGNICISPTKQSTDKTGSFTLDGLSPSTAYKIKTHWHRKARWYEITTRIVTTNPSPAASGTVLRYQKTTSNQKYCVDLYWKNPPAPNPTQWTLALGVKGTILGMAWASFPYTDLTKAAYNSSTGEYTTQSCSFSNNEKYRAYIYKRQTGSAGLNLGTVSNQVEWK